ncbi:MAG: class II aldolase/adducin family protein [Pseudomonadota bacterium]
MPDDRPTDALVPGLDTDLDTARRDLAAAYRLIAHLGYDDGIYTHISLRVAEDRFLLNPFGLSFDEIRASGLVTIDHEGRIVDDPLGRGVNAAGFTIHSAVHMARHDVACVAHTHTVAGVAVSCLEEGLLPLNQWALEFYGRTAFHDYEGIALDLDERERLVADLGDKDVMILRNHGMLTCGRSVGQAIKLILNLERACQAQVAAFAGNRPLRHLSPETCQHTVAQYLEGAEATARGERTDHQWLAYLRLLDRVAPDYKD